MLSGPIYFIDRGPFDFASLLVSPTMPSYQAIMQAEQSDALPKMSLKKIGLAFIFIWFLVGGIGHFVSSDFFLKIVPPSLPWRLEAVYISGFFELVGAFGLLHPTLRRAAGKGLIALVIVVTPANVYMWINPQLFTSVPEILLALRLVLQVFLLALIWWATQENLLTRDQRSKAKH